MDQSKQAAEAEERAHSAESRFQALLEAIVDAVIVIDSRGNILEFSSSAVWMFGYQQDEVVGKNVSILMPEPYRSGHDQYIANYLATGDAKIIGYGREVKAQRKDGSVFPMDLEVSEIKGREDSQFIGVIHDISLRKASELEMREQRERLAHVTRLSTMGEMAAGIAHEVNQPLTAIVTYANAGKRMLAAARPDLTELASLLEKLGAQALRAGEVIRRLRSFVRKREGEYELASLNDIVNEVTLLAEVDSRHHGVDLIVETGDVDPKVVTDRIQIQQVLLNLIRNAIEAVDEQPPGKRSVRIKVAQVDDSARVEIIDQGSGMAEEVKQKLFMPFQTTKQTGMGMGLSISRSIVESHKGSLAYRDNPDGGTIFYFDLPAAETEVGP